MRARVATLVFVLALLAPAGASAQAYTDWNAGFPGFPSNAARNARADCADGSPACIGRTIREMYRRFHTVIPVCDHNAVFSLTYIRVTEDVKRAVDGGFYPDRRWLQRLDAMFARTYFLGFDNWAAGRRGLVSPAWRIAFDSARARQVSGIGNLLLSMNAHINRDFPFVLYLAGLSWPDGRSRKPQHDAYNSRLRALYRPMLTELSRRFDATIDDYDAPGTTYDDDAIFQILVAWREGAWRNAERLRSAGSDAGRRLVAAEIEQYAESQARFIHANTAYRPGESSARRDARCALYGGQDPRWRPGQRVGGGIARSVGRRRQQVSRRGRVTLTLACPAVGGDCRGRVLLRRRRLNLGQRRFSLRAGTRRTVKVKLRTRGHRLVRRRRRLRVEVLVRSRLGPGRVAVRRAKATLVRGRRPSGRAHRHRRVRP